MSGERGGANGRRKRRALRLAHLGMFALMAGGCSGRTVEEEDCRSVGNALRDAWRAEVRNAPRQGPANEKGMGIAASEGEHVVNEWLEICRRDLMGTRVDGNDLDCLERAKTLGEMRVCNKGH